MAGCFPEKLTRCLIEQVCQEVKRKSALSSPADRTQHYIHKLRYKDFQYKTNCVGSLTVLLTAITNLTYTSCVFIARIECVKRVNRRTFNKPAVSLAPDVL